MPSNTSKQKKKRREPTYVTCLLVHGPKPENWRKAVYYKTAIIQWWMDSITGDTPPETNRSGHRFYARFMSWYHAEGKREITTVVKEQDDVC